LRSPNTIPLWCAHALTRCSARNPAPRLVNGGETVRIVWTILHGLELRLAEWVVVGGVRAAVAFGDAQIGQ
jgi:hypothetical protein